MVSAWSDGDITVDELVRYGYLTVFAPEELPDEYVPEDGSELDEATYVRFILSRVRDASEETQEWIGEATSPSPAEDGSESEASTQGDWDDCGTPEVAWLHSFDCRADYADFEILYNVGADGVPEQDTAPANGRPDAIDEVYAALADAYRDFQGMGFEHDGDGPIRVFLGPLSGSEGMVPPAFPGDQFNTNPILLGPDPAEAPGGRNTGVYNYLPRHELFHVFQYNYISDPTSVLPDVNWWMEATAEWATRESLQAGPGSELYASAVDEFLDAPEYAINEADSLGSGRQYGAFVVASYFSEAVSPNFVLDTWRTVSEVDEATPMEAIQQVVSFYGRSMDDLLLGFAAANYRLDQPSEGTFYLGAQDGYEDSHAATLWRGALDSGDRPPRDGGTISQGESLSGVPDIAQGGVRYVEIDSAGAGGRLNIDLEAHVGDYQYALFTWEDGTDRPDTAPVDMARAPGNEGSTNTLTASLGPDEVATLMIARTDIHPVNPADPEADAVLWHASLQESGGGPDIMVVGDSITHGNEGSHSWRYVLDQHLNANGEDLNFVGPRIGAYDIHTDVRNLALLEGEDPPEQEFYPVPSTASYYDNDFDRHHNAMWGWTFDHANNSIRDDVQDHDPDYLLIALGFNDITWGYSDAAGTVDSARTMIEEAREANPDIRILLSNVVTRTVMPDFEWLNPEIREYADLLEAEVPDLSTTSSPVHLVDISSGFDPVEHAWDGVHPNSDGDFFIGAQFADAMHAEFGVGAPYGSPPDPPDVELGQPGSVRVETTDQGFRINWDRVFGAAGYHVWTRNVTEGEEWTRLPLAVPGDYFYSTWVRRGDEHEFRVAAARGDGNLGPFSETASATADPQTLPGPANVTTQVDGTDVTVGWDSRSDAVGYRVYWIEALGNYPEMRHEYVDADDATSFQITGLEPGMRYDVAVSSVNEYGAGIPTGALNQVEIPGASAAAHGEERVELGWEAEEEALTATGLLWDGYPEGTAPIPTDTDPLENTTEPSGDAGQGGDHRAHVPLPGRREEAGG